MADSKENSINEKTALKSSTELWETDPRHPRNWPTSRKWITISILSLYEVLPPMGSCMMGPGLPEIAERYDITNATILGITLSIFALSQGIGPLIMAPLSEMYGRKPIVAIGNFCLIGFNIGCVFAPTAGSFIGFRFLAGFAGSAAVAVGGGAVADVFAPKDRAGAMSLYVLGPLIGPAIGPVLGGFITQYAGVRYIFVVLAAASAVMSALGVFQRETYAPVLRARIHKNTGEFGPESDSNPATHAPVLTFSPKLIWLSVQRPTILLTRSLICFMLGLYMASIFGMYYLMFTTFPILFTEEYGFSTGVSGLPYLGLGVGFFAGSFFGVKVAQKSYTKLVAKNGGQPKPEMRLPALIVGSLFIPVGLFWYGWSAQAKTHWIVPIIGTSFFAFGMVTSYMPINLYLVDTFEFAASALAATVLFRALCGFAFPLFGQQMFDRLGYGGGNSLLAGLAILFGIPFPIFLYFYGEGLRKRSKFNRA